MGRPVRISRLKIMPLMTNKEKAQAARPLTTGGGSPLGQTENGLPRLCYSMAETAEILGVSYISVWRLLKRKVLKSSKAFRHPRIPLAEIHRFLKETTV